MGSIRIEKVRKGDLDIIYVVQNGEIVAITIISKSFVYTTNKYGHETLLTKFTKPFKLLEKTRDGSTINIYTCSEDDEKLMCSLEETVPADSEIGLEFDLVTFSILKTAVEACLGRKVGVAYG